jgi:hypothetical protein
MVAFDCEVRSIVHWRAVKSNEETHIWELIMRAEFDNSRNRLFYIQQPTNSQQRL